MPSIAMPANENKLRQQVAARARELGGMPRADDIAIAWMDGEPVPGARLFRARWQDRAGERGLSGLVLDEADGEADTLPLRAIDAILARSIAHAGRLPAAAVAARACAWMLDGEARRHPILDLADPIVQTLQPAQRQQLQAPAYDNAAELPLSFWWIGPERMPSRIRVRRDRDGRIATEETPVAVAGAQGGDS